jgi:hypothetical protein
MMQPVSQLAHFTAWFGPDKFPRRLLPGASYKELISAILVVKARLVSVSLNVVRSIVVTRVKLLLLAANPYTANTLQFTQSANSNLSAVHIRAELLIHD